MLLNVLNIQFDGFIKILYCFPCFPGCQNAGIFQPFCIDIPGIGVAGNDFIQERLCKTRFIPFIVPIIAVLVAITYVPSVTLALPHLLKTLFG